MTHSTPSRASRTQREPVSESELKELLRELDLSLPKGRVEFELVSEWAAKHVWRVKVSGKPWAYIRYLLGSSSVYPERWRHLRLSQILYDIHVGPKVLGLTPESEALQGRAAIVERSLNGISREALEDRAGEAMEIFNRLHSSGELLEALSLDLTEADRVGISPLHQLFAETRERWFSALSERWIAHGFTQITTLTELVGNILDYLEMLEVAPIGIAVPAHNDPNNGNFMLNPRGELRMIDFEELALNNPVADLGVFLTWYVDKDKHYDLLVNYELAEPDQILEQMKVWVPLRYLNIAAHWGARLFKAKDSDDWEFAAKSVYEWLHSTCELTYHEGIPDEVEEMLSDTRDLLLESWRDYEE